MRYDSSVGQLRGTRHFYQPGAFLELTVVGQSTDKHHAREHGSGSSILLVVTIDPQKIYTLGVSSFNETDVSLGILHGAFIEGTEFMTPTGRARIMGGKLKYTNNKAIYKLPEMRV